MNSNMQMRAEESLLAPNGQYCTYSKGAIKRQSLYWCVTCCPKIDDGAENRPVFCNACYLYCHGDHEVYKASTDSPLRCECPTKRLLGDMCILNDGILSDDTDKKNFLPNVNGNESFAYSDKEDIAGVFESHSHQPINPYDNFDETSITENNLTNDFSEPKFNSTSKFLTQHLPSPKKEAICSPRQNNVSRKRTYPDKEDSAEELNDYKRTCLDTYDSFDHDAQEHPDPSTFLEMGTTNDFTESYFDTSINYLLLSKNQYSITIFEIMYRLEVSTLCAYRLHLHRSKYPGLQLGFGNEDLSNIILHDEERDINVKIEYTGTSITYGRLFNRLKKPLALNNYFESFVKNEIDALENPSKARTEYLVIYTNAVLVLTSHNELPKSRCESFYPFQFEIMDPEKSFVLEDFFFTKKRAKEHSFYQFSQDKTTRKQLSKRLKLSGAMLKAIDEKYLSKKSLVAKFLKQIVFAASQPSREELNIIVREEVAQNNAAKYSKLRREVVSNMLASAGNEKAKKEIYRTEYEFNVLLLLLLDLFIQKKMSSLECSQKKRGLFNDISITFKEKRIIFEASKGNTNIGYLHLFPNNKHTKGSPFSINRLFSLFTSQPDGPAQYVIVYTDVDISLNKENKLRKSRSKEFFPLKFDSVDIQEKRHKFLKHCSCLDENGLYKLSSKKSTKLIVLNQLTLPGFLQQEKDEGRLSADRERELKEDFYDKLIFAVRQPDNLHLIKKINSIVKESEKIPFKYTELQQIALRWSEGNQFGPVTKELMERLHGDVKSGRCSFQNSKALNAINMSFAKAVIGGENNLPATNELLRLLNERGYLQSFKNNKVRLPYVSAILRGAGDSADLVFQEFYGLLIDERGKKSQILQTLERNGINLCTMRNILNGSREKAAKAFKRLYDLWFDEKAEKTLFIKRFESEGINLKSISNILHGAGAKSVKTLKKLHALWFDQDGNKTPCVRSFEEQGVRLVTLSAFLFKSGKNAVNEFKELYNFCFTEAGRRTQRLKNLKREEIELTRLLRLLSVQKANKLKGLKELYGMWFDEKGSKTEFLQTLESHDLCLEKLLPIFSGADSNVAVTFRELYDCWFNKNGRRTEYLSRFVKNNVELVTISGILSGAGVRAALTFHELHDIWFEDDGSKTQCLVTLEGKGATLADMCEILNHAGNCVADVFAKLYNQLFDETGNGTKALQALEEHEILLPDVVDFLRGSGADAARAFKFLIDTFFSEEQSEQEKLRHFIGPEHDGDAFKIKNLFDIFIKAGSKIKKYFTTFHHLCFDEKGNCTELLEDLYEAGFTPRNLSCLLKTGSESNALKTFHSLCFSKSREKSRILNDFYSAGFKTEDICAILSGGVSFLSQFHHFCFVGKTKNYLNDFISCSGAFTPSQLSEILHGSGTKICVVFEKFHNICFDGEHNLSKIYKDFLDKGFESSILAKMLSKAGRNAPLIFNYFHKSCFEQNFLSRFLENDSIFTPKILTQLIAGNCRNLCLTFKNLYETCFDEAGIETKYFRKLIKNGLNSEVLNTLRQKAITNAE